MARLILGAKLFVAFGLLAWLGSKIDTAVFMTQLRRGDPAFLLAGTAVLALSPAFGAIRWQFILRRLQQPLPFRLVAWGTYAGTFFNQVLPVSGGDGVRIWMAVRAGAPLVTVVNSVVLDRVAMVLSLVVLVVASAPAFNANVPAAHLRLLSALLIAGTGAGLLLVMWADRMPEHLRQWRITSWLTTLSQHTRALLLSPASASAILGLSAMSVVNLMISTTLFVLAFGATASALQIFVLLAPVIAISTLPISFGAWGTREVAMVATLGTIDIPAETAILASVWFGLAGILISAPGAFSHLALGQAQDGALPSEATRP